MMFPVAVVLVALAASPAPAEQTPAEAFSQAEKFYAADRFGEAEPLLQAALRTEDRFLKRQVYNRLMNLYVRSGRPDKAIRVAEPFRAWLKGVGDTDVAMLELLEGQCRLELGYAELADKHLVAAINAKTLPAENQLEAMRFRVEAAVQRKDAKGEKDRLAELEKAAREFLKAAEQRNEGSARVIASRYLAEAVFRRGETDEAFKVLAHLPDLHDQLQDPLGKRDTQRQRAKLFAAKGKYEDAAKLYEEALRLHFDKYDEERPLIAGDILAEWSVMAQTTGRVTEAAELRKKAVAKYRAAISTATDDPDAGGPLAAFIRLQALTRSSREFPQALKVAVTVGEKWSGDPLVDARLKSDRGSLELMTSAYPKARESLSQALTRLDAAEPPNLRALPKVLVNLATAELACDTPEKADALLARCAKLYGDHKLPADAVRVECAYLTGVASARRGDFAQAMSHFRGGLALCDTVGTAADPVRFNLWLNVALIHKEQGDATAANESLKKASAVLATFSDPDDGSAALIDAVRADLYLTQGQVAPALALVPNLEAACAKHGYHSGYLWATAKHVRALDSLARKDIAGAEKLWLELAESQKKEGHVLYARTLNFLGICAELRGNAADAVKRFEDARAFQADRPYCPPVTKAITLWRLAVLVDKSGKKADAKKLLSEVFDVADRARLNTFGEAAQRAQFFSQFAPAFELLAAWCARDNDGDGLLRVIVRSRSRTLLDQMLATGIDPRDRLTGDARTTMLKREANARQTISRLRSQAMMIPTDEMESPASKKLLADLEVAQKEYTDSWREIANADPLTRVLTDPAFAENSLAQVRKEAHKSGGVLLTYMIGRDESFAVLSTDPNSPPQVFRLAVAKPVAESIGDAPSGDLVARAGFRGVVIKSSTKQPDRPAEQPAAESVPLTDTVTARLVDQYLRQIADPQFNPTRGVNLVSRTPNTSRVSKPELLGDAVLPPALREKLRATNAKRIVVIPDGALHKLPFECLLLSSSPKAGGSPEPSHQPKYVIDELPPVCYAPSIAALAVVLNRTRVLDGDASLLTVGDPAYPEAAGGTRSTDTALPRLPYTAIESKKVRQFFATDRVLALEQADATEAKVVAALPGKRFVHLAAHGFADKDFGNAFAAVALTPPPHGSQDPGNDGFLTLHEISRLKLSGCELTVLSACVTNVGPQRPMEAGVTLAGAFLGAGSRSVMASCWSVDDAATAELMAEFFGAIRPANGKGLSYPEALKQARLAIRAKQGWAAPFYWAPFVYLGPPD
jgi:CHAT domain-containing protein/tetratricopeptide (TPR) repeat protein